MKVLYAVIPECTTAEFMLRRALKTTMDESFARSQTLSGSLSTEVVTTVASVKNTDVMELKPSLYEVIDTDALDSLFANRSDPTHSGHISFEYAECQVTVRSDGHVLVHEIEDETAECSTTESHPCQMY